MHVAKNLGNTYKEHIEKWMSTNMFTLGVGEIINVDRLSDWLVDVQPTTLVPDADGVIKEIPPVQYCPVILQGNADGHLSYPLKVGTRVLIGYPRVSIEEYVHSLSEGFYEPVDGIQFGCAQAVVLGTIGQVGVSLPLNEDNFEISFFDNLFSMTDNKEVTLTNKNITFLMEESRVSLTTEGSYLSLASSGTVDINSGSENLKLNSAVVTSGGNLVTGNGTDLDQLKEDFDILKAHYEAHVNHPVGPVS